MILNIHTFEASSSLLETHRLNYLLSRGKCVVSEKGIDKKLAQEYTGVVNFVNNIEEMIEKIHFLLTNEMKLMECEEKSRRLFEKINCNYKPLHEAMNKMLVIMS